MAGLGGLVLGVVLVGAEAMGLLGRPCWDRAVSRYWAGGAGRTAPVGAAEGARMPGGLSGSATWNPGSSVQRWFPELPWPTEWLARLQGWVRGWQDWPSVVQPPDPVAVADRMPAFHLAWMSGVRDVSVLLGLVLTELAARRIIHRYDVAGVARPAGSGP